MALVQKMKFGGATTFGELSLKYYTFITSSLSLPNCQEVHVVFDQYWSTSIKANERSRRGASTALEVRISNSATPVPKQWEKYISNSKNKINLCDFISTSLCQIGQEGQEKFPENKSIVIGEGFRAGEQAVHIRSGSYSDVPHLRSSHEEADTRLVLHAQEATEYAARIVIRSPDRYLNRHSYNAAEKNKHNSMSA